MHNTLTRFAGDRLITILYSLAVLLVITFLYHSNITGYGSDISAHYSLIDKIDRDFIIGSGYTANLFEMVKYPPGAHYIASFLDHFTGSALLSMNLVNLVSLFCIWVIISKILLESGPIALIVVSSIIGWVAWRGLVLPILGLEVVAPNFLYGQFVATAYFIVLMYAIYRIKFSFRTNLIVSLIVFYVGLYLHATFALIYLAGSCFYFIFNDLPSTKGNTLIRSRILSILGYGVTGGLIFLTHPYTKFANEFKLHDGHLAFSYFTTSPINLSSYGTLFIISAFLISGLILLFYSTAPKFRKALSPNLILIATFLLGATCIAILQLLLFYYGETSPYVVKKNLFGIFTFFIIIVAILFEKIFIYFIPRFYDFVPLNKRSIVIALTPLLFILISVIYWSSSQVNFDVLRKAQGVARDYHEKTVGAPSYRNTVAQFHELPMAMNWLITIGELQVDKLGELAKAVHTENMQRLPDTAFVLTEAREDGVADNGYLTGQYRVYSAKTYNSPLIAPSGKAIIFNDRNPYTKRYLSEGFSLPEPWGVWSAEEQAEIRFSLGSPPTQSISVVLTSTAWLAKGHESFIATAFFKGKQVATHEFTDPKIIDWQFYISPRDIGADLEVAIKLKFTNSTSPLLVGQSADPRLLGVGLHSLKVVY